MQKTLLIMVLVLAVAGCQKSPPQQRQLEKLTVSYTYQPQSTLVHIAVEKGYFQQEGLDVQAQMRTYGKAALRAVLDRTAELATVAEAPLMFNILNGEKILVVANIDSSAKNNAVVARRDAGIGAPGDLRGKRIGYSSGTTSEFFLDYLLTANGMDRREIEAIDLAPEEMLNAVATKRIDAACTWNYPLAQISESLGPNAVVFYDQDIYTETFNIAGREDFVRSHPETIRKFLRALLKAESFVKGNPDAAQGIMSRRTTMERRLVRNTWDKFEYHVGLDQILLIMLEDETRWAIRKGLTAHKEMPDYRRYIDFADLDAVRPEAVRITH